MGILTPLFSIRDPPTSISTTAPFTNAQSIRASGFVPNPPFSCSQRFLPQTGPPPHFHFSSSTPTLCSRQEILSFRAWEPPGFSPASSTWDSRPFFTDTTSGSAGHPPVLRQATRARGVLSSSNRPSLFLSQSFRKSRPFHSITGTVSPPTPLALPCGNLLALLQWNHRGTISP